MPRVSFPRLRDYVKRHERLYLFICVKLLLTFYTKLMKRYCLCVSLNGSKNVQKLPYILYLDKYNININTLLVDDETLEFK